MTRRQIEEEKKENEAKLQKDQIKMKFESAAAELTSNIDSFVRVNSKLSDSLGDASISFKQKEWEKIELEFDSLKKRFVMVRGIDPSMDMNDVDKKFEEAEGSFMNIKKWLMTQLKDSPQVETVVRSSSGSDSSTRKEPVKLPMFQGDEKASPFLKYPTWKERWETLIGEYDVQWHATILLDHLDDAAKNKFIGYDSNYKEAMKRLDSYYGDPRKVVACVMKEVLSPRILQMVITVLFFCMLLFLKTTSTV